MASDEKKRSVTEEVSIPVNASNGAVTAKVAPEDADQTSNQACKPSCLQPGAKVWPFLVFLFASNFNNGVQGMLIVAVLTTLEKLYQLPSSKSGFLITSGTIASVLGSLFVSYFGSQVHVARLFSACSILTGISASLYLVVHFVFSSGVTQVTSQTALSILNTTLLNVSNLKTDETEMQFCHALAVNETVEVQDTSSNFNSVVYCLLLAGEILHGLSSTAYWTVGVAFMDNHTKKGQSSRLIGLFYAVRFAAPVLSFGLTAWFLTFPVNFAETNLTPEHPKWVGAWWLGYALCGCVAFFFAIALATFPGSYRKPVEENEIGSQNDISEHEEKNPTAADALKNISELPRALWRLLRNSVLILTVTACAVDLFQFGFFGFLPKFIEVHFEKPAFIANILGGMILGVLSSAVSPISGFVSSKLRPSPAAYTRFCGIVVLSSGAFFAVLMAFSCPEVPIAGSKGSRWINLTTGCNVDCACSDISMDPVCGSDGNVYFSACHAGCQQPLVLNNSKTAFDSCSCIPDGIATAGSCSMECPLFIPYIIFIFISFFLIDLSSVPLTDACLRSVKGKDKPLALALLNIAICISLAPAPALYGSMVDSACVLPQVDINGNPKGACLIYSKQDFRYRLHGLTVAIKVAGGILYLVASFRASWMERRGVARWTSQTSIGKSKTEKRTRQNSDGRLTEVVRTSTV